MLWGARPLCGLYGTDRCVKLHARSLWWETSSCWTPETIPADAELLKAESLQVNESNLMGEPVTRKSTDHSDFDKNARMPRID